jgi:hypothetical protein
MEGSMTAQMAKLFELGWEDGYPFETSAVDTGGVIVLEGCIGILGFNKLG